MLKQQDAPALQRVRLTVVVPATNYPPTLDRCLDAIQRANAGPEQLVVIDGPSSSGPADARNRGAAQATGDVLVFVDADVEVRPDAFERFREAFRTDPSLTAVFGSYDDEPDAQGHVSTFRNLLHHHVHQEAAGPAETFWAGLGAIRRDAFLDVGGFDDARFPNPSIEDIELGMRLVAGGASILLDPLIQGKHLKKWTLVEMIRTDFAVRGVPWVGLLLRNRQAPLHLNLGWRHRLSAACAVTLLVGIGSRRPRTATGAVVGLVALNHRFYRLLLQKRGAVEASLGPPLHAVHHVAGASAVPVGAAKYLLERLRARRAAANRTRMRR
jgi:hypothetical protein